MALEPSQLFTKTLNKLSQDSVRSGVTEWLEKQDPKLGIAGRDLIGQLLSNATPDDIIVSYVDVATTLLFLENVSPIIDDTLKMGVLIPPPKCDKEQLTPTQFSAYTSLYLFYRQRNAKGLYLSPYLESKLNEIRAQLEPYKITVSYISKDEFSRYVDDATPGDSWKKLVERGDIVSKDAETGILVIPVERLQTILTDEEKIPSIQIRSFLQKINDSKMDQGWLRLVYSKFYEVRNSSQNQLLDVTRYEQLKNRLLLRLSGQSTDVQGLLKNAKDLNMVVPPREFPTTAFDQKMFELIKAPLASVAKIPTGTIITEASKKQILQNATFVLENWLSTYNDKSLRPDYSIFLTGLFFAEDTTEKIRATVFDQVRWGYFDAKGTSIYIYTGGFLDPVVRAVTNSPDKVFFAGVGAQQGLINLSVFYEFSNTTPGWGGSVGYKIPLSILGIGDQ
jgi:hypothetical protein